jgi:hypothetical protein
MAAVLTAGGFVGAFFFRNTITRTMGSTTRTRTRTTIMAIMLPSSPFRLDDEPPPEATLERPPPGVAANIGCSDLDILGVNSIPNASMCYSCACKKRM